MRLERGVTNEMKWNDLNELKVVEIESSESLFDPRHQANPLVIHHRNRDTNTGDAIGGVWELVSCVEFGLFGAKRKRVRLRLRVVVGMGPLAVAAVVGAVIRPLVFGNLSESWADPSRAAHRIAENANSKPKLQNKTLLRILFYSILGLVGLFVCFFFSKLKWLIFYFILYL